MSLEALKTELETNHSTLVAAGDNRSIVAALAKPHATAKRAKSIPVEQLHDFVAPVLKAATAEDRDKYRTLTANLETVDGSRSNMVDAIAELLPGARASGMRAALEEPASIGESVLGRPVTLADVRRVVRAISGSAWALQAGRTEDL